MKHTTRLALMLMLTAAAHARAGQPVRVREAPATDRAAEHLVITSPYVRVELRPHEQTLTLRRIASSLARPQHMGQVDFRNPTERLKTSGYLVHRHSDGSVTVAIALRGGAVRETKYLHVPADLAVITLRTVSDNHGAKPAAVATTIDLGPGAAQTEWLAGVTAQNEPPHAGDFAGWYDAGRSLNLVVTAKGGDVWSAARRETDDPAVLRVGPADWTQPPTLGVLEKRVDDLYLTPVRGVGRVTQATPHVALAAERSPGGWRFGVHPTRTLSDGKLTAKLGQRRYEQTINAEPNHPAFVDVPLDTEAFDLRIVDAHGRSWLSTDLRAAPPAAAKGVGQAVGDMREPGRDGDSDASRSFAAALSAIKARDAARALELLKAVDRGEGRAPSSLVVLLRAIALIETGERDEATRTLRNHVEQEPGLVEAWLLIGDTSRVRKLTRYDKQAWSDAQATLMALQAGRWPTK